MTGRAKYLLILVFFLIVFVSLFFIYRAVNAPSRTILYADPPTYWEKIICILGAGKIEEELGLDDGTCILQDNSNVCVTDTNYSCVYK